MSQASELLAAYLAAELAILKGQTVTLGDKTVGMANLAEVRAERRDLERRVAAETRAVAGDAGARHQVADFSR
jgi:hypothetical protein